MDSIAIARELRFSRAKRKSSSVDSSLFLEIYRVREVCGVATVHRRRLSEGKLAPSYGFPFGSFATRYEAFLALVATYADQFAILVAYQRQDQKILFTLFEETIGNVLPVGYAFPDRREYLTKSRTTSLERVGFPRLREEIADVQSWNKILFVRGKKCVVKFLLYWTARGGESRTKLYL